jgi:hypothetical protein
MEGMRKAVIAAKKNHTGTRKTNSRPVTTGINAASNIAAKHSTTSHRPTLNRLLIRPNDTPNACCYKYIRVSPHSKVTASFGML